MYKLNNKYPPNLKQYTVMLSNNISGATVGD